MVTSVDIKVTPSKKKKKEKLLIEVGEMGKNMVTRMDIKVTLTNNKKKFPKIYYWKPRSEAEPQ